jgi:hypothetical protein
MSRLEDLRIGAPVRGVAPDGTVTVKSVQWYGLVCEDAGGRLARRLVYRDGVHSADPSDLMRRFDGRPLFPERRSYTVQCRLSDLEGRLSAEVREYPREPMNRAVGVVGEEGVPLVNVGFEFGRAGFGQAGSTYSLSTLLEHGGPAP